MEITIAHPWFYIIGGAERVIAKEILGLTKRGHKVTLYEKDKLGGQFNLASLPPNKDTLSKLVDYYKDELKNYGIPVVYKEVNGEDILTNKYDEVILATGAEPAIPRIEGLTKYFWAEVLSDENLFQNKKVVIIGGGLIGIEIAHKLLKRNNEVIIVEMFGEMARGMEMIEKALTLKSLKQQNVPVYLNSRVTKVAGKKVFIEGEKQIVIENVDHIIVAAGMKSYNPLESKLKDKIPLHVVGDAKKVGKAQDAIRDGFETASKL